MDEDKCAACGGKREDHGPEKSRHVFTQNAGELKTHEQLAKEQQQGRRIMTSMPMPSHPTVTDRLIEVMLGKGLIDRDEALYIVAGVPLPTQAHADPVKLFDGPSAVAGGRFGS